MLTISLNKSRTKAAIFAAALALTWQITGGETFTVKTYYPVPYGAYKKITVLGETILARDGGAVGIGTASPAQKLDVNGKARMRSLTQSSDSPDTVVTKSYLDIRKPREFSVPWAQLAGCAYLGEPILTCHNACAAFCAQAHVISGVTVTYTTGIIADQTTANAVCACF